MPVRASRALQAAVARRLQDKPDAYVREIRPGLILAFAQGQERGATNPRVFELEKTCLVRFGASPDAAHDWLVNKAIELRSQMGIMVPCHRPTVRCTHTGRPSL